MANPPPKQENNNNKKMKNSKSIKLNIGGMGIGGIGGIVLLGGALVAATLVSTLAIKRRRSSSKNIIDESNQDFGLQNSSDEATGMKLKEMQPKPNRFLTPDENQDSGVDSGDDGIVGEDQESALIRIDSVSEVENGYEKTTTLECEQQSDVASQTESGFPSITASTDGGGGENDSDTDVAGTEKSLDSIEGMEEYEAVEVEEIPSRHVVDDQETVFMNDEAASLEKKEKDGHDEMISENCEGDLIDETGYPDSVVNELETIEEAKKIEVEEDNPQVQILEEEKEIDGHDEITVEDCEGDSSYKTGEITREEKQQTENSNSEQVKGEEKEDEEAIKEACVETVNMEEMQLNQVRETISNGDHPSFAVNGTTVTEGKETAQEVEQVTAKDEFVNEEEKDIEGEMPQVQLIEVEDEFVDEQKEKEGEMPQVQLIEVNDQPVVREDNPPTQLMTTEEELVEKEGKSNEDKIPLEEAKNSDEDASEVSSDEKGYSSMQKEVIPEAKIDNHMTIVGKDQNDLDQDRIVKEDKSASNYKERFAKQAPMMNQPWNLKLLTWSLLASIWCICHCYSKLPFPELSLVGGLLFVFILLGYRKHTKYSVKYE